MNECRNVLSDVKVGEISEMKETRIIHSHTKNYVCVLSPLVSFPEECVGEGGVSVGDECGGRGMKKCMMQSKVDGVGRLDEGMLIDVDTRHVGCRFRSRKFGSVPVSGIDRFHTPCID